MYLDPGFHGGSTRSTGSKSLVPGENSCSGNGLIVSYQSYHGSIFNKFDDGVGRMDGGAVMCEEGVEEGAEDPALWCSTLIVDDM